MDVGGRRIFGGVGIIEDITERSKIEEVQNRLAAIVESADDTIISKDLEGIILSWNKGAEVEYGYNSKEVIGKSISLLMPPDHPDDYKEILVKIAHDERIKHYETKRRRKDGQIIDVSLTISPLKDSSGKIIGASTIARNITERKRAEEEIRKLDSVVNFSNELVNLSTLDGKMIFLNETGSKMLGIDKNKVGEYSIMDVIPEIFMPTVRQELIPTLLAGNNWEGDLQYRNIKTGVLTDVYAMTFPIKDAAKKTSIYLANVSRDITERKQAEKALKNSEAKYRDIFENAIEGIYQSAIEGRFITANAALARMAGYDSPEELIESVKDIETQFYVHPEDRKRFMEIREAKGFVDGFEVEFYKKDGSTFWVVVNARTVKDERGKILYFEGLIEDITIRKHAEGQLHKTINSLKKAVGTTIQVLGTAAEARDPYTAGHQKRVADLARVIATEMGLA